MCGIFGMAAKEPKFISSPNLKILGMMNESRGKTSCGVTIDGELFHGYEKEKLFTDFAKGRSFAAKKYPVVFGHTRQASTGMAVSKYNIHPFGFGNLNDGYEFVFCHNGTLLNHKELAEKYEIATSEEVPSEYGNFNTTRQKIDSELLGEIIYKTGSLKVLSEYNGRAALVWQDLNRPNIVYLYSGKSVPDEGDDISKAVEERPMNVWVQNKNVCYFSSMPESLEILGANEKDVFQIDYNTVYVVKDGNFKEASKIRISRRGNYHTETYRHYGGGQNYGSCSVGYNKSWGQKKEEPQTQIILPEEDSAKNKLVTLGLHIYDDKPFFDEDSYAPDKVYNKQLRYYSNGVPITGIYVYVRTFGFRYVAMVPEKAVTRANALVDVPFNINTGKFDMDSTWKPFEKLSDIQYYYFVEGVLVDTLLDYTTMKSYHDKSYQAFLTPEKLSMVSKYPVVHIKSRGSNVYQGVYYDGKLFTGNFKGIETSKTYFFDKGNLVKVVSMGGDIEVASATYLSTANHKDVHDNIIVERLKDSAIGSSTTIYTKPTTSLAIVKDDPSFDKNILAQTKEFIRDFEIERKEKIEVVKNETEKKEVTNPEIVTEDGIGEYMLEITTERFTEIENILSELRNELNNYRLNPFYTPVIGHVNDIQKIVNEYIK